MSVAITNFLQMTAIYILLGWGVYLNYRNGQLHYGNIATMAIGAYAASYVVRDLGWPHGAAFILALGFGALVGFLPALGLARAEAFATAIATIGLLFITQTTIRNLWFLGAMHGFYRIPKFDYLPVVTWITVLVVGFIVYRIDNSRLGRAMETAFVDPDMAATMGVNRFWLGVFLQTFSGALGGLAGAFFGFTMASLQPTHFNFAILLRLISFVFIGGSTTMWGLVVFTPILWAVTAFIPREIAAWSYMIYGILLIVILMVRPEGVIDRPLLRTMGNKIRQWRGLKPIGGKA